MALLNPRLGPGWQGALPRRAAGFLLVLALLHGTGAVAAAPGTSAEYRVKAVFLFNFVQFVDWPARTLPSPQTPIVIGILGNDPFGSYLDELVKGEKIGSHPLVIRRYQRVEDVVDCHVLFISSTQTSSVEQVLARLQGRSLLTVGDGENFSRLGGMVRFVTENGRIRLRINPNAAQAAELTISSKLLRSATLVTAEKD